MRTVPPSGVNLIVGDEVGHDLRAATFRPAKARISLCPPKISSIFPVSARPLHIRTQASSVSVTSN
jgi:hypothetical protein